MTGLYRTALLIGQYWYSYFHCNKNKHSSTYAYVGSNLFFTYMYHEAKRQHGNIVLLSEHSTYEISKARITTRKPNKPSELL